jgi:hypothetical protein
MDTPTRRVPIIRLRRRFELVWLTIGARDARAAEAGFPHLRMLAQPGSSHMAAIESIPDKVRVWAQQDPLLRVDQ